MASEVFVARESSVSPLNSIGISARRDAVQTEHLEPMGFYGAVSYLQEKYGMDETESYLTVQAFDNYTGGMYTAVRRIQQRKKDNMEYKPGTQDFMYARSSQLIESFIERAPKWKGETYRGIVIDEKDVSRLKAGKTINMRGTSSWSSDLPSVMRMQGENQGGVAFLHNSEKPRVYFICKSGQPHGTSTRFMSHNPGEKEVTVSKKAEWKITKVDHVSTGIDGDKKYNYNTYFVYVEPKK